MARKVMRTIRDAREELSNEMRSTQPLLTDSFTYGNITEREDNLGNILPEENIEDVSLDKSVEEIQKEEEEKNNIKSCGCNHR